MSIEDVMSAVNRWLVATEALAAVGAELTLARGQDPADPAVSDALRAVPAAAGLGDLSELAPPQREMVISLVRMALRQAQDLLDDPGRAPGWAFTDPDILQGWGRGSMLIPAALAAQVPELAQVRSFLDVGTGIGLLAVAAARTWPDAAITGIDVWPPSLRMAEDNIRAAGLADRVVLRQQDVAALDDENAYDCVWFPTFFVTEPVLTTATARLVRSLRVGGWLVLGRMPAPPDPLAGAVTTLRTIRAGGSNFEPKQLASVLEDAGCANVRVVPRQGPMTLEYVIGQRSA